MMTLPQLKALAKQNNIRCTFMNKDEIIALLIDNTIITPSDLLKSKTVEKEPVVKRYGYLKGIKNNPKKVEVLDKITEETTIFPSIYKTHRAIGLNPVYIKHGATLKNRYVSKVS